MKALAENKNLVQRRMLSSPSGDKVQYIQERNVRESSGNRVDGSHRSREVSCKKALE